MFEVFLIFLAIAMQPGAPSTTAVAAVSGAEQWSAPAPPGDAAPAGNQLVAEPQTPTGKFTTATEVKPILNATKANWVAVREWDGQDLIYVTHIWSWRCGLAELRIGVNGAAPEVWPLPECHMEMPMPSVMLEQDGLPYREFPLASVQQIEVQITYDDLSTDVSTFARAAVLMP